MHVSHRGIYNMSAQSWLVQPGFPEPSLSSNRKPLFLPLHLHCDGVQAVYRHNIWQSKRSSGGYCVSLGKWLTPWEGGCDYSHRGIVCRCASERPGQNGHIGTENAGTRDWRWQTCNLNFFGINGMMFKLPWQICELLLWPPAYYYLSCTEFSCTMRH